MAADGGGLESWWQRPLVVVAGVGEKVREERERDERAKAVKEERRMREEK